MNIRDFYVEVGGNFNSVIERFSSVDMIKRFLFKFVDDPFYVELHDAFDKDDVKEAFRAAHTIKGIVANLGLDNLYRVASDLTETLRHQETLPGREVLLPIEREYKRVIGLIEELNS